MAESVYKVIELIGTSKEFLGEGRCRGGQSRWKIACAISASPRS